MGFMQQAGSALAGSSSASPWLSLGLTAGSSILGAMGQSKSASGDADAYNQRADINEYNADQARITGQYAEGAAKAEGTRTAADQKAAFAGNGVSVDSKTVSDVTNATVDNAALDAAMLHFNAAQQAYGLESEAAYYRSAAKKAKSSGKAKIASTLLGGAMSLASKWDSFKSSGAIGGSSSSSSGSGYKTPTTAAELY